MTKEELKEILLICCTALKNEKKVNLRVSNNIVIKEKVESPWKKNTYVTEYRYTIIYERGLNKPPKDFHFNFFDIESWPSKDDEAKIKFGKKLIEHLWHKTQQHS